MTAAGAGTGTGPGVSVRDLSVVLDGARILDRVSLDVAAGQWVTVIGPNGAGKSTLLRAVAGLVPYTGTVAVLGAGLARLPRRVRARRVAVVVQDPVVPPGMAVLDYVLLGRTPYLAPLARESAADLAEVRRVLDRLDLAPLAGRRLESLSGGERQRAFLARALAQGASVLLLDEPTTALDIGHQQEVLELVDQLRRDGGLTVLATTHDLALAGGYAQRLVLLARGAVVAEGTPAQVLTERLLGEHYRAQVSIVDSGWGPVVIPVRPAAVPPAPD